MKSVIETKYAIGDLVHLFGYPDWPCIITAITVRASGQTEYQLEWNNNGEPKSEWYEEKRMELMGTLLERQREWEHDNGDKK